jgi:hypothetical protein
MAAGISLRSAIDCSSRFWMGMIVFTQFKRACNCGLLRLALARLLMAANVVSSLCL